MSCWCAVRKGWCTSYICNVVSEPVPADDGDGIANVVEDAAPGNGDYDSDGTKDSEQNNVATLPNPSVDEDVLPLSTDNPDRYNALVSAAATDITAFTVESEASQSTQDADNDYPLGLYSYTLTNVPVGSTQPITIILDQQYDTTDWVWRKYNQSTGIYTDIPASANGTYGTTTVGSLIVTTYTYSVTDGGALDQDGIANGIIVDPVGPGVDTEVLAESGAGSLADTGLPITYIMYTGIVLAVLAACQGPTLIHTL